MPPTKSSNSKSNPLQGKTIVFTGALQQPRAAAKNDAERLGAIVTGSVSGKTDILIAGPGAGQKIAAAQAKGVEIWTEDQFLTAISGGGGGVAECKEESKPAAKKGSKQSAPAAALVPKPTAKAKGKRKAAESLDVDAKEQEEPPPPPAVKKGKKAAAPVPTAPAPPASPAGPRGRRPDSNIKGASAYSVVADYDVKLVLSNIQGPIGNNKVPNTMHFSTVSMTFLVVLHYPGSAIWGELLSLHKVGTTR
jgi:hypothetical protein